jgi:hypothetical protein
MIKSSPKDFAVLYVLLLLEVSSSFSIGFLNCSGILTNSYLNELGIS